MYDKHSDVQNYAHYPVELRENERVAYGTGVVADSFTPPPGREEPLSHAHYFGMGYLLAYAETTGLVCPVAMTAGVAHVDPADVEPHTDATE